MANRPKDQLSIANFAALCKEVGATPVWVLNLVTLDPQKEMQQIDALKAAGVGPTYIEMGNEYNAAFRALRQVETGKPDDARHFVEKMANSPLHALFVAGYLLSAIENQDVYKVIDYHSLEGMEGFGIIRLATRMVERPRRI